MIKINYQTTSLEEAVCKQLNKKFLSLLVELGYDVAWQRLAGLASQHPKASYLEILSYFVALGSDCITSMDFQ